MKTFMKVYYIVLETGNKLISDVIETYNDMDTTDGLVCESARLEKKYGSEVILINWKKLNKKGWIRRLIDE
jgi:hypothetical protein